MHIGKSVKKPYPMRALSALLCVMMVLSLITVFPLTSDAETKSIYEVYGATGFDFTDNTYVAQKLSEVFELLPYSDYPYFTTYGYKTCGNSACTNCCVRDVSKNHPNLKDLGVVDDYSAYSCFGFARWVFLYIYGIPANGLNYQGNINAGSNLQRVGRLSSRSVSSFDGGGYDAYTVDNIRTLFSLGTPGDIIQARSDKNDSNHTMIYLGSDAEGFYIVHNNSFKKRTDQNGNAYGHNHTFVTYYAYTDFMATYETYVSLLRAKQDVYEKVWENTTPLCEKHTYTDESCGVCTVCGYKYKCTTSSEAIGLYRAKTSSALRHEPYSASASLSSIQKDGYAAVTSDAVNVSGELWYRTVDGKYIKASDFEKVNKGNGTVTVSPDKYPTDDVAYGKSFDLSGTISASSGTLTQVFGALISATDGNVRQSASAAPASSSFDIYSSDLNHSLKFASLAKGDYYYMVAGYSSKGDASVFISPFTMTNSVRIPATTPAAPALASMTHNSVTLTAVSGAEFSMDAKNWQTSPVFENLTPNTQYKFYRRTAETSAYLASAASKALSVTTDYDPSVAPPAPVSQSVSPYGVVFVEDSRLEYRISGGAWQKSNTFSGLTSGSQYSFTCRVKTSDGSGLESEALTLTLPRAENTYVPDKPTVREVTDTTITLVSIVGAEYSRDGGKTYQKSTFFDGLAPATSYSFTARYAQTDTHNASNPSKPLTVSTIKSSRRAPDAFTVKKVGAYSVTLEELDGAEYRVDGGEWQDSCVFEGLSPVKKYLFEARYKETAACYASEATSLGVTTDKITPDSPEAPVIVSIKGSTVTLGVNDESAGAGAIEFSLNGGAWQSSAVFDNLPGYTELSFRARTSETELCHASAPSGSTTTVIIGGEIKSNLGKYDKESATLRDISAGVSVDDFLDSVNAGKYTKVYSPSGDEITDGSVPLCTGMKCVVISPEDNSEISSFTAVVTGDSNGDGAVTLADMISVKAQTLSGGKIEDEYGIASDVNGDGIINIADFIIVKAVVLGKATL